MSGMKSWSTTPANNVLANTGFTMDEGQAPSTLNDSIRQAMADIRTEWAQGANIASAATVDLSTATGGYVHITGVVTITSFGTVSAGIRRRITFDGALTLTHNASSLILPTGGNITTVAGDTCEAMSEGSGNWRVLWYSGKNVQATTVTASTSVVTPLVTTSGGDLNITASGATSNLRLNAGASADVIPTLDNTHNLGGSGNRWKGVFTPIIDSGTTVSLALKTNGGTTAALIVHTASAVNPLQIIASAVGSNTELKFGATGSGDTNVSGQFSSKGTGSHIFVTDMDSSRVVQFQVLHTASATRNITVTGSNGGNPTLSTTAGSLAITPAVVCASTISATALIVGATNPAASGDIRVVNGAAFNGRNTGNTADKTFLTYNDGALTLSPSGDDIKWGKALVALGGGAAPTFGTIGGTGPATAAQNTWMRILDSGGVPFWVPAWK